MRRKPQNFGNAFKSLDATSNVSVVAGLLATGSGPLPKNLDDWISPSGVRNYLNAHVVHGIFSRGGSENADDISLAYKEQDEYWRSIRCSPDKVPQLGPEARAELEPHFCNIHGDMLKTLSLLRQVLDLQKSKKTGAGSRTTAMARMTPERVLRVVRARHDELFGLGHPNAPYGPATEVSLALDDILRQGMDQYLDLQDVSALVAQLIVDQGTITRLAAVPAQGSNEQASAILDKRKDSRIKTLSRVGFVSLNHAAHIIQALDYFSTGLTDPQHKLNRVLRKVSRAPTPSTALVDIIASMATGEEIKLEAGWGRGLRLDGLVARAPFAELNYIGSPFFAGVDKSYTYALTVRKEAGGLKVILGRTRSYGFDSGINSWYGLRIVNLPQRFIEKYNFSLELGASLAGRYERGNEDLLNFTIADDGLGRGHLRDLLTGKKNDLDKLLKIERLTKLGNNSKSKQNFSLTANAYIGPYASGTMFLGNTALQGQIFPCPVGVAVDAGLYAKSVEKGFSVDAETGTISETHKEKSTNFLTHRNIKFTVGSTSTTRGRVDFCERDDLVIGPIHNMPVKLQAVYTLPPASWTGIIGGHAKPDCGEFSCGRGPDGKYNKISWDLTLPPSEKILEHPAVLDLMKDLTSAQQASTKEAILDAASFTTRENRQEIQKILRDMKVKHPSLAAQIDELKKMSKFLSATDRWLFRWHARALVGGIDAMPERVISRLSGMQAFTTLGEDITALLKLTEKYDGDRWPFRKDARTITFKAEATDAMIARVNESEDPAATIRKVFSEPNNGLMTGLSVGQSRVNSTSFALPLPLVVTNSSARLTLGRKCTWSVKEHKWDRPLSLSSKA